MKKISLVLAITSAVFTMASCNKTDEPYMKDIVVSGDRIVLLEDYTGVKCVNCPDAAVIAHELLESYPKNLVVLSVHAGYLATPFPGEPDYRTEAGTNWYETFGFSANPIGTVNRTKVNNGYGYNSIAWGAKIAEEINKTPEIQFSIEPTYDESTRKLDILIKGEFTQEITGDFYIFAGIMEDSIQGKQVTSQGLSDQYWHCHMFRQPLNGNWGESLFVGMTDPSQQFQKSFSTTIDSTYNADQCYVVSYVYNNAQDKVILQAGQAKIK